MNFSRGLIIVEPYGSYIRDRTKSVIVKSKKISSIVDQNLLLIENKIGLGIIQLAEPTKISLSKFGKSRAEHLITEVDRDKWWAKYTELWSYTITKQRNFKIGLLLNYPPGPQITVKPENIIIKKVHIGMSGYYYPYMYPPKTKSILNFYSKKFSTVEINSTYYKMPSKSLVSNLKNQDMVYSIKVNRNIIYTDDSNKVTDLWSSFYSNLEPIHSKIKYFLFQFNKNYSFSPKHLAKLKYLTTILCPEHRYAFEFRNMSWQNNLSVKNLFEKNNWTMVMVNVNNSDGWASDLPTDFVPSLKSATTSSGNIYIRMHGYLGQYIGSYPNTILDQIFNFIKEKPIVNAYIYFNNTIDGSSMLDANRLVKKFNPLNQII